MPKSAVKQPLRGPRLQKDAGWADPTPRTQISCTAPLVLFIFEYLAMYIVLTQSMHWIAACIFKLILTYITTSDSKDVSNILLSLLYTSLPY